MTKNLFNSLTIIEQINFFNEKLKEGFNISEICSDINISYNTIRHRFSKNFYTYNKLNNRYECIEKIFPLDEEVIERALEKIVTRIFASPQSNISNNLFIVNSIRINNNEKGRKCWKNRNFSRRI